MNTRTFNWRLGTAGLMACAGLAASANANVVLQKIIENTDAVPGITPPMGTTVEFVKGSNGAFNVGGGVMIDNLGRVIFRGDLTGTGVIATGGSQTTPANSRAVFYGLPGAIDLLVRSGDAAPNGPAGMLINDQGAAYGPGLGSSGADSYVLSPNGWNVAFSSRLNAASGAPITATYAGVWAGPVGGLNPVMTGGSYANTDFAPGTAGAQFSTQGTDTWSRGTLNNAGQVVYSSSLKGGDTVTGTNSGGVWVGSTLANSQLIWRTGDIANGPTITPNAVFNGTTGAALNGGGKIAGLTTLRAGTGDVAITGLSNQVMVTNHAGSLVCFAQEGANAPTGLIGVTFAGLQAPNPLLPEPNTFNVGNQYFNNVGRVMYSAALAGDVTTATDSAVFVYNANNATTSRLYREGDSLAIFYGAGVTYGAIGSMNDHRLNNNNKVAYTATLTGGTITTANDSVLFMKDVGSSSLTEIAREGQDLGALLSDPGLNGVLLGSLSTVVMNNNNKVIFTASLTGAGVATANNSAVFAWDEVDGLCMIVRKGDEIGQAGSGLSSASTFVVSSVSYTNAASSEGGSLAFSDTNWFAFRVVDSNATSAQRGSMLIRTYIPTPGSGALVALAGLAAARRRRR